MTTPKKKKKPIDVTAREVRRERRPPPTAVAPRRAARRDPVQLVGISPRGWGAIASAAATLLFRAPPPVAGLIGAFAESVAVSGASGEQAPRKRTRRTRASKRKPSG